MHVSGADKRNRTPDLMITNQLLYHLSYVGFLNEAKYTAPLSTTQPENRPSMFTLHKAGSSRSDVTGHTQRGYSREVSIQPPSR